MKKALSILLAIAIVVSLGALIGCGKKDEAPAKTPAEAAQPAAEGSTPAETPAEEPAEAPNAAEDYKSRPDYFPPGYIQGLIDKGEKVMVALVVNDLTEWFLTMCEGVKADYAAIGVDCQYSSSDGDFANMMSLMENYATMGAKQLAITPNEYGSFYDFSRKFMEQGIQVVFLNVEPPEEILNTSVYYADELNMGKCMGNMAMHWINTTYPDAGEGELHVGCLLSLAVPMLMRRTQGYQDILKADPRVDITFESSAVMTYDEAMNAAQDGFTVDPDIKLFMCFEIEGGTAVSNYICSLDGVDLSKYAVFAGGDSESARALVEQAATNNGSVLRGIAIEYSETGKLWEYWFNASYKPLFGEVEIPYYLQGRNMTVNSVGYIDP